MRSGLAAAEQKLSCAVRRPQSELESAATMLAPYGALAVALAVSVVSYFRSGAHQTWFVFALQIALSVVVMVRQVVMLIEGRSIATHGASDAVPVQVDRIQYKSNQGPCLDAIRDHAVLLVNDLATDPRHRLPRPVRRRQPMPFPRPGKP